MKVRLGFVSNSSTSSFCIYGVSLDETEDAKFLAKFFVTDPLDEFLPDSQTDSELPEEDRVGEVDMDALDEAAGKLKLESYNPEGCGYYIGRSWSAVRDDQTGKQFKEEVRERLSKLLGVKVKSGDCDTHDLAYAD